MRLYELIQFNPSDTNQTKQSYVRKIRDIGAQPLGSGSFGAAFGSDANKRLNQVTKIGAAGRMNDAGDVRSVKKIEQDGYLSYLNAIHTSNSDNPYFPQIHDLKIMKQKDGKLIYRVNLEKLVRFESAKIIKNEALMATLYDDMFVDAPADPESFNFGRGIGDMIDQLATDGQLSNIKDPDLRAALEMIRKLARKGKFITDLHSGNLMWRITGTRPQLVILDPLI